MADVDRRGFIGKLATGAGALLLLPELLLGQELQKLPFPLESTPRPGVPLNEEAAYRAKSVARHVLTTTEEMHEGLLDHSPNTFTNSQSAMAIMTIDGVEYNVNVVNNNEPGKPDNIFITQFSPGGLFEARRIIHLADVGLNGLCDTGYRESMSGEISIYRSGYAGHKATGTKREGIMFNELYDKSILKVGEFYGIW